ncbi:deoxyribodipyrimidine photo-lyase [Saccharicrinis carchari]|uniref:Deoxyribodipyrimidine photo-lyase n=1 Tax=Saccharicrinis carchari TaxID=1168039 RepID=A0A521CHU1_SACCC|nr:deoxyribodipyrimidine photo-lyase [Saccharicrinis carchari]SMO59009.1 deoxyribodipyrimidine photo-lyase [Saccharicrinis carchari]
MKIQNNINIVWLRRDLRLNDNTALIKAGSNNLPVLLLFIFDEDILDKLEPNDSRVTFIYDRLHELNKSLKKHNSSIRIIKGKVLHVWESIFKEYQINAVYANEDYEPYAIKRDTEIMLLCRNHDVNFNLYKDHVIFARDEVLKKDGKPYTVYTPYKNQWLKQFKELSEEIDEVQGEKQSVYYAPLNYEFPSLQSLGFERGKMKTRNFSIEHLEDYASERDLPFKDAGSYLGPHLRFGTVSIREIVAKVKQASHTFLLELIWREFFMQIMYHFPQSTGRNFKSKYDWIKWRNNEDDFARWCNGTTGYPMVDAGMRELNQTGYMHNRVRMVTASFLCKHLLIDWQWGEAYFAEKLLDFELSSNVGNWQWAAGTGCDAAPYFRVFNPILQQKKFDPDYNYIRKWIPELGTVAYPQAMVEHSMARKRALEAYKKGIESYG